MRVSVVWTEDKRARVMRHRLIKLALILVCIAKIVVCLRMIRVYGKRMLILRRRFI